MGTRSSAKKVSSRRLPNGTRSHLGYIARVVQGSSHQGDGRGPQAGAGAPKPRGRDQVVAAVLESAAELFAARGFAGTSLRDVAADANVNVGLIHRHIGNRPELVRAVFEIETQAASARLAERQVEELDLATAIAHVREDRYMSLVAHAVLEGMAPAELGAKFPMVEHGRARIAAGQADGTICDGVPADLLVAVSASMLMGWAHFGALFMGDEATRASHDELFANLVRRMMRP